MIWACPKCGEPRVLGICNCREPKILTTQVKAPKCPPPKPDRLKMAKEYIDYKQPYVKKFNVRYKSSHREGDCDSCLKRVGIKNLRRLPYLYKDMNDKIHADYGEGYRWYQVCPACWAECTRPPGIKVFHTDVKSNNPINVQKALERNHGTEKSGTGDKGELVPAGER